MNTNCPFCGKAVSPEDIFCDKCGSKLPRFTEPAGENDSPENHTGIQFQVFSGAQNDPVFTQPPAEITGENSFSENRSDVPSQAFSGTQYAPVYTPTPAEITGENGFFENRSNVPSQTFSGKQDAPVFTPPTSVDVFSTEPPKPEPVHAGESVGSAQGFGINGKVCPMCANTVYQGEKYCIKCGASIENGIGGKATNNRINNGLQDAISMFFQKDSILSLFGRIAWIFAFYYPMYLIINHIDALSGLYDVLGNFSVIMHYLYIFALIVLYGNRKYLLLMVAVILRALNSIWILCISTKPTTAVERLLILIPVIVYLGIRYSQTNNFARLKNRIKTAQRNV